MFSALSNLARLATNWAMWALLIGLIWLADPQAAYAQTTTSYIRTDDGAITAAQACNATPLTRTFSVTDSFIIGDVDLGVIVDHTWRGDLRIRLTSPAGTTVQLTNGDVNAIEGNNFNVLLNDEGTQLVNTDGNTRDQSGNNNPPFQNDYIPNNPLSAFDGQGSAGTWTMEICDLFPSEDDGTFRYAELFLTSVPGSVADLSLAKSVSNSSPVFGASVSYTLSVSNAGPSQANNVEVLDQLPVGFEYSSASGFGAFDPATGVWSIANVPSGQTRTIVISGTVSAPAGATIINRAEISAADEPDIDSTPGNNSTAEDDDASASFTVQGTRTAGIAPTLVCPVGTRPFDWDDAGIVWQAGVPNQSFSITNFGDVAFSITNQGTFEDDAGFGGQSPAEATANSGGLPGGQSALNQFIDFDNRQQTATTVITLPNAISGAQFTIFDVDFGTNDFADLVTVTGSYQGATVIPELTNGTANYVVGNTAIGDQPSGGTSGAANVTVTFDQAIDQITIVYGNAPTAPVVPDGQAIAIHDFTFCAPQTQLSVTKVSSVIEDPVNADPADAKAIPGAIVEYVIQVSNTGISATDPGELVITDFHSAEVEMCGLDNSGGPIAFIDPGGATGLTYSQGSDLAFSEVGDAGFGYAAQDDGTGCDANIDGFRITPDGMMAGGSSFTLRVRYRVIL
ncbi:MAG: proprotein convertase P-domain-containing protein [Pseudomonadota bacterium]